MSRDFEHVSMFHKCIYSGVSGAIATTSIYPIDIVKTKLMNQKGAGATKEYTGPIDCAQKIWRAQGFKGFFKGWPPAVILVMPEKALKLTLNDYFRREIRARRPLHDLPFECEMAAGGAAGFIQVVATNPMELLKIQGATMADQVKRGEIPHALSYRAMISRLGVTGLYTGVVATWARDVPFSMVYFSLYSQTKQLFPPPPPLTSTSSPSSSSAAPSAGFQGFIAGAIAGTVAAAITCPIDVLKTRVHASALPERVALSQFFPRELSLLRTNFSRVLTAQGPSAFFNGLLPRCAIISPLFAITMSCFEWMQQHIG